MQSAFHTVAKVLPGNKIEFFLPTEIIAKTVDVFVVLPTQTATQSTSSVLEIINSIRTQREPRAIAEIDRELQVERNSWDN